jgi:hypothetical protein
VLRGKFQAQNLIKGTAVNPTEKLHSKKNITLGHTYILLQAIRLAQKEEFSQQQFWRVLRSKIWAKNSIQGTAVNLTEKLHSKKYIILGHKPLAPGNKNCVKRRVPLQPVWSLLGESSGLKI